MIVIDVLAFIFVVACVGAAIKTLVLPNTERRREQTQIDRANRLILKIQVTDEVMTMLPAHIRTDIDNYAEAYIHGGKQ